MWEDKSKEILLQVFVLSIFNGYNLCVLGRLIAEYKHACKYRKILIGLLQSLSYD